MPYIIQLSPQIIELEPQTIKLQPQILKHPYRTLWSKSRQKAARANPRRKRRSNGYWSSACISARPTNPSPLERSAYEYGNQFTIWKPIDKCYMVNEKDFQRKGGKLVLSELAKKATLRETLVAMRVASVTLGVRVEGAPPNFVRTLSKFD